MPTLIDRRGRRDDHWVEYTPEPAPAATGAAGGAAAAGDAGSVLDRIAPDTSHLLLPLATWQTSREALLARAAERAAQGQVFKLGLVLGPADDPAAVAADLPALDLVAIHFPRFTDGRGYSIATELRETHGWRGELRAVGDILRDQLFYLSRCGFDTFNLRDDQPVERALAAFGDFSEAYQASVDRGALFERRRAAVNQAAPQGAGSWGE